MREVRFAQRIRVHYTTETVPNRFSLTGVESARGCLILVRGDFKCLTPDAMASGASSEFDELAVDRGERTEDERITVWVKQDRFGASPWNQVSPPPGILQRLGFHRHRYTGGEQTWLERTFIPYWFVTVLCMMLPTFAIARSSMQKIGSIRAARRRAAGLCIHCGYDLRATPARCPECGRVPEGQGNDIMDDDRQAS
jgi:hypothetical protein